MSYILNVYNHNDREQDFCSAEILNSCTYSKTDSDPCTGQYYREMKWGWSDIRLRISQNVKGVYRVSVYSYLIAACRAL